MKWYVSQNRKAQGPLSEQRVEMLVRWGKISRAAYICDEQSSCWVPITRSRFGALLAPLAVVQGGAPVAAGARMASGASARAWRTLHPWLAFALLILFCTLSFVISLQRSAGPVPRSSVAKSNLAKSGARISSNGRAPVAGRFAR